MEEENKKKSKKYDKFIFILTFLFWVITIFNTGVLIYGLIKKDSDIWGYPLIIQIFFLIFFVIWWIDKKFKPKNKAWKFFKWLIEVLLGGW